MPAYFLDSSALVKAYRREAGTQQVVDLLAGSDPLIIARLAHVEVSAALVRRGRDSGMSAVDMRLVLSQLDSEFVSLFQIVDLSDQVVAHAAELTRTYFLRAADALQLACAISARRQVAAGHVVLVGSDVELNAAANAESFDVLDPTRV